MSIVRIGFDVYGFDQNAKEDQESIEKASQLCKIKCLVCLYRWKVPF